MGKLTEKQLLGITIGVFAVLVGGLGFFAWWLYNGTYQERIKFRAQLKTDIEDYRKKFEELKVWKTDVEELKKKETEYAELLPSPEDVTRGAFINMLASFEQQAGVQVSEVTEKAARGLAPLGQGPGPGKAAAAPFETVEFKFTVKGGYYEVVQFMYLIESNKRLMKVTEGDIVPDSSASTPSTNSDEPPKRTDVTLNVSVATYIYNQPKPTPAGGS